MLLYYITDRSQFPGSEAERRKQLLGKVREAAAAGIDYIQLREKDLPGRQFEELARETIEIVRANLSQTRLLINSRTDVACSITSDGVHLPSHDISPLDVRRIWQMAGCPGEPLVSVSCHSEQEVQSANARGADFVVFGPVFEKGAASPTGITALKAACSHKVSVLALGGITIANARACLANGAAGVAGIRLFQQGDLGMTVQSLRG